MFTHPDNKKTEITPLVYRTRPLCLVPLATGNELTFWWICPINLIGTRAVECTYSCSYLDSLNTVFTEQGAVTCAVREISWVSTIGTCLVSLVYHCVTHTNVAYETQHGSVKCEGTLMRKCYRSDLCAYTLHLYTFCI